MLNKKMLLSLLVIGVVSVSAGAGTFAYFSDDETSTSTLTAGELDLVLSVGSGELIAQWSVDPMAPGDTEDGTITLTNNGDLSANHVEIDFTVAPTNVVTPDEILGTDTDDADISDSMNILSMTMGGVDILPVAVTTVADLDGLNIDDIAGLAAAGTADFYMNIELDSDTDNSNQGDSVEIEIVFTLNQDANQ